MKTEHFYPELARVYSDYPWLTFDRALNVAARTLCTLGLVWRIDLDFLGYDEGSNELYLLPPSDTRIVQVTDTAGLIRTTPRQLTEQFAEWRDAIGAPTHFYPLPDGRLRVYPTPQAGGASAPVLRAAIAPTTESKELSDDYAWDYERLLLEGAFAYLGRVEWQVYEQLCREARSFAVDGAQIGVPRAVKYGGY